MPKRAMSYLGPPTGHHLDGAAGQAEGRGPHGGLADEPDELLHLPQEDARGELLLDTHAVLLIGGVRDVLCGWMRSCAGLRGRARERGASDGRRAGALSVPLEPAAAPHVGVGHEDRPDEEQHLHQAKTPSWLKAMAHGMRKTVSMSKTMKSMAIR
jgi:hypothetical protein